MITHPLRATILWTLGIITLVVMIVATPFIGAWINGIRMEGVLRREVSQLKLPSSIELVDSKYDANYGFMYPQLYVGYLAYGYGVDERFVLDIGIAALEANGFSLDEQSNYEANASLSKGDIKVDIGAHRDLVDATAPIALNIYFR
ncbi:MAG: hypothetical protein COT89_00405 [Candidatus Colwellbacteria bacterium CG10_big_fil_rev_8_21_14_0_10_42_22]|uniref:Uncharacterized protein n=1 Tax=Candidatus Colwellbacteria bacterium CG10_big_fil_rev_8_21_14_0_10_42_22 TaxID=1974540 RepID=A0A2H0VGD3_9BACT|nr:MAG: hypothetical protein COT89_00405 [Candidatus Colwellbacteria bacterium CG10_big_fil_rev_8_21_14_0_10_42_22]